MAIQLPKLFAQRLNNLVSKLDAFDSNPDQEQALNEALSLADALLESVDANALKRELDQMLGAPDSVNRANAKAILERDEFFTVFMELEEKLFRKADISEPTRARMSALLHAVRPDAIAEITSIPVEKIMSDFMALRNSLSQLKVQALKETADRRQEALHYEKHTRIVNSIGTATLVIDAGAAFAAAGSILFLPAMSVAACVASATLGGVAQSRKPPKPSKKRKL